MATVAFAMDNNKSMPAVSRTKNNLGYSTTSSSSGVAAGDSSHHSQTLRLDRTFTADSKLSSSSGSASLPRDEPKPLKGILVNQSSKSHDTTPISSPRNLPDFTSSARTLPPVSSSTTSSGGGGKRNNSSSSTTVADFLRKFSPKLGRSKKSLQWYTVDIQPSSNSHSTSNDDHSRQSSAEIENDPTVRSLQNGRISSEFSSEMSECLAKKLPSPSAPKTEPAVVVGVVANGVVSPPRSTKPTDLTDFVRTNGYVRNNRGDVAVTSSVSKSMPATPVTSSSSSAGPWRMMMVDIDIEKNGGLQPKNLRNEFFKSEQTSPGKHVGFRSMPQYNLPPASVTMPLDGFRDHVPSYIKLSRALNGYSARNMYTSKKLVSSRDYNSLLCKSEEYLNKSSATSSARGRPEMVSARGNTDPSKDFRRAASADRDSSLLGREVRRGVLEKIASIESKSAAVTVAPAPEVENRKPSPRPGHEFVMKLDAEVKSLRELCAQGEKEVLTEMPEEALEQLRSAIGKTNLLLTQKFEQFRGLCNKNINETDTESLKTTVSDLQGFWDMMSIQIHDVRRMFAEVERLKSADWKEEPHHTVDAKTASVNSSSGTESPKLPAGASPRRLSKPKVTFQLNPDREVQRKELIAAKRRAFEELQQQQQGASSPSRSGSISTDEVQIFMPAAEVQ